MRGAGDKLSGQARVFPCAGWLLRQDGREILCLTAWLGCWEKLKTGVQQKCNGGVDLFKLQKVRDGRFCLLTVLNQYELGFCIHQRKASIPR